MMPISTKGRYSIRILVMMASHAPGTMFTKAEIAEAEDITPAYVQQLMTTLLAAGFASSHRGKVGGFTLVRDPETTTVAEVLRATEGPIQPAPCCLVGEMCQREFDCRVRPLWKRTAELLQDLYGSVTIAELALGDWKPAGQ